MKHSIELGGQSVQLYAKQVCRSLGASETLRSQAICTPFTSVQYMYGIFEKAQYLRHAITISATLFFKKNS